MEPAPPPSRLEGARVLVTRAHAYMGPAITERFGLAGAEVVANPSGRPAAPWESAELALFLAGPGSDFFHGQVIPFAGGSALNV